MSSVSPQTVSSPARWLMGATAVAFALMGLALFVAPEWASANFSWKISPFVAMTMGGWYLGNAVMAGVVAIYRRWNLVYASALYVGLFAVSEAAVLVVHQAKLNLGATLAYPYIGMLALAILAALACGWDWLRQRPVLAPEGTPAARWMRPAVIAFIVFVLFLALFAFSGHWIGLNGVIFPEPLSLFTLHSFGAFYGSLALSMLVFVRVERLAAVTVHGYGGFALIALITVAALAFLRVFNFAAHPFQAIYLGVYLVAALVVAYYLWDERRRRAK